MEYIDYYHAVLDAAQATGHADLAADWNDFGLPEEWGAMCIIETIDGGHAILFDSFNPDSQECYIGVYKLHEIKPGETHEDDDWHVFNADETPALKPVGFNRECEDMYSPIFEEGEEQDGDYYADATAANAQTFVLNVRVGLSEAKYDTLRDVTGQESGLVVYPGGGLIIGNWSESRGYGVPVVSPFGGMMNYGNITSVKAQGKVNIKEYLASLDWHMVWDDNNDMPSITDGDMAELWTVAATGGPLRVLAPEGWN